VDTSEKNEYLGSSTYLWGLGSISASKVKATKMGVAIQVSNSGSSTVEGFLNEVDLVVYWSTGGAGLLADPNTQSTNTLDSDNSSVISVPMIAIGSAVGAALLIAGVVIALYRRNRKVVGHEVESANPAPEGNDAVVA